VHLVIDAVGGRSFRKSYRLLAPMGRLFMFGASSLAPGKKRRLVAAARGMLQMPTFRPVPMMNDNRGVFGVNLGHLWDEVETLSAGLAEVLELVRAGTLDPHVDRTFSFADAAESHRYLQDRKNFGKVVLVP
jgi:NADPH:quinone reductase-like Zn-dependent oxidoreductase